MEIRLLGEEATPSECFDNALERAISGNMKRDLVALIEISFSMKNGYRVSFREKPVRNENFFAIAIKT